ncbi:MAG: ABC transporter ATP-binding protein [Reyranellaceae bacterium]
MGRFSPPQHSAGSPPPEPSSGAKPDSAHPRLDPDSTPSGTPRGTDQGVARGSRAPFALRLSRASLAFDGVDLFRDLALDVPYGRWTSILGPSGVGKSSLLRLIAGLLPPRNNMRIDWQDADPASLSFMAQTDLLLPWLSVLDNVLLGPRLRRVSGVEMQAKRQQAYDLLERLGLQRLATRLPATLSGGQRQRVALARTLLEQSSTVLMDEPFSQLDAITRHDLQNLAAQAFSGRTVIMVTHDPLEALRLSHRIVVLAGRPAEISAILEPVGEIPRETADPGLHAELMRRLQQAAGMSA